MELLMPKKLQFYLMAVLVLSCSHRIRLKGFDPPNSPSWENYRGDAGNTAFVPSSIPTPNKLLWKFDAKKPLKSSPIFLGKALVMTTLDKKVFFLDAVSGKRIGTYKLATPVSNSACGEHQRVYFGPDRGKETFVALDVESGKVLWEKGVGDVCSSPVICGAKIFVGSTAGTLWAFDKMSGEEIWKFEIPSSQISTPACQLTASSVSDEGTLYFGSAEGYLYAVRTEDGQMRWRYQTGGGIYSAPAVKNGKVFFGSTDGNLYALSLKDGSFLWKFKTQADIYSSPAVAETLVYIGSNDYSVYAVNQNTGRQSWRFQTNGLLRSSPIVVGDKLFFGSFDGNFYVLNRFTGKLLWKYQTEGMISGSPSYFDGKIYIGSEDGYLYCFGTQ
jgi:outer membrane protein assembly factor BamB